MFGEYEVIRQAAIHFAGDHCSVDNQRFTEGAAESARAAALEIIAAITAGGSATSVTAPSRITTAMSALLDSQPS